jgi:ketosteroid isomerase-like protein
MTTTRFETAQDAEDRFYDALEENDLEGMMAVWATGDVACVLPMSVELTDYASIRAGWERIFQAGTEVEVRVHHRQWIEQGDSAIHLVHEELIIGGNPQQSPPPLVATNVYRRGADGWRMVLHHVSPLPPKQQPGLQPGGGIQPPPGMVMP